ncbi:Flp pilus assembly protein CpaB [Anatilimnocola sp. NA78]|uniref:Flp pilus assembly protein CpaB n=1 Tax=Anatilimnocola sp. NA78 TaxID=3415683 RepID=UPI003CE4DDC3
MRMKSLILIFIALGCGLVASIGISQVMERGRANAGSGGVEMEDILVTLKDIDINSSFDAQNVKLEPWPKVKMPEGAVRNLEELKDKFARQRFIKGEPILIDKITDQVGAVAPLIPPGFRAMPVKVEEDTVMKGISPGDRVDINLYVKRGEEINASGVYTIMKAVRVFAVGSNTEKVIDPKGQEAAFRTVSLLVTPEQMRDLTGALQIGRVTLALRHPNETGDDKGDNVTPLADILKGKPDETAEEPVETPVAAAPVAPAGPGFLDMLSKGMDAVAKASKNMGEVPVETDPGHTMHIYTNSEVKQYQWQDRAGMPQESTVFTAGVAGPTSSPPPAPAAGAGVNHRPSYLLERRPVWMTEQAR